MERYFEFTKTLRGSFCCYRGVGNSNRRKQYPYWIVRNSWGTEWGNKGYFKMKRGTNNCEIEENVFVCYPSIPGIRLYLEYPILYHLDDYVIRGLWGIYDNGIKLTTKEKLILKKIDGTDTSTAFLYNPQYWVDFSKMIAGDDSTFHYMVPSIDEGYTDTKTDKLDQSLSVIINILLVIIALKIFISLSSPR